MASITQERTIEILMIEDSKSDVLLFQHLLGPMEAQCRITDVPRMIDAFKKIGHTEYDVILLDLNLLDLDGIANIATLKAECPFTPIIVYSGRDDARLKMEAQMIGAFDYLVKGSASAMILQQAVQGAIAH